MWLSSKASPSPESTGSSSLSNNKLSSAPLKQPSYFTGSTISKTYQLWAFQLTTLPLKRPTSTFPKSSVFASTNKWSTPNKNFSYQSSFISSLNSPMIQMWAEFGRSKCITISSDLQNRIWLNSLQMKSGKCKKTKRNWNKFGPKRTTWLWNSMNNTCTMKKSKTNKIWWNNLKLQLKLQPNPQNKTIPKKPLNFQSRQSSLQGKKSKLQAEVNSSNFGRILCIKFTFLFYFPKALFQFLIVKTQQFMP